MRVAAVLFACVAVVHGFAGNLLNPRAAAGQRSSEEYAKPQTATQSTTDSEDYMEDKKSKHPGHHPTVGYFKRLCAGDKGVLDDQNRHIPPMREEEIDQWFKVHEVLWTHPPTIVYKVNDEENLAMYTKKRAENWKNAKSRKGRHSEVSSNFIDPN
ncbi:unnamed protein product [Notodromas monacha]|uniref:Uncharacterized protein n=1 Tax=Notodromas monacha TaxID=399045 RepID=A0A7R9C0P5_9CRUS|nr:unnamed protein product [Notodromas monacha]CAG0923842.1 unnamed protein product [Notodromas monacha]